MKKLLLPVLLLLPLPVHALTVVATLPSLAAIAKQVGGAQVQVESLTSPHQDPHYADAKPSLIVSLNRADVLVVNGLDLEVGWLPPLLLQSRNARIQKGAAGYVDASQAVRLLGVPKGPIDRAMGDVHPGGNPHFLLDPRSGARVALLVAKSFAKADPPNAATYQQNASALAASLDALAATTTAQFAQIPAERRRIVVYHDSLTYLVDWLGVKQVATLEPRPGIAPSPQHVAEVLQVIKSQNVKVIAQEEFYPKNTGKTLAGLAHGALAVLPGGADFPTETYAVHIKNVAQALRAGL